MSCRFLFQVSNYLNIYDRTRTISVNQIDAFNESDKGLFTTYNVYPYLGECVGQTQ
jgi:hypothetical protein